MVKRGPHGATSSIRRRSAAWSICAASDHAASTSTRVSLKHAPSARSARSSAETRALIVCPVTLVVNQAPFSEETTPGLMASVMCSGKITSPRSFQTLTLFAPCSARELASVGCMSSGGVSEGRPPAPNKLDEIRLSDAGDTSESGNAVSRVLNEGNRADGPHRFARTSEASSIFPDGVAGITVSNRASGRASS